MTVLSVNVNKIAVLRNSRGGDEPSVVRAAETAIAAGCGGITVHPRPDQRHIRPQDVVDVRLSRRSPAGAWQEVVERAKGAGVPVRVLAAGETPRQSHRPDGDGRTGAAEAIVRERAAIDVEDLFAGAQAERVGELGVGEGLGSRRDRLQHRQIGKRIGADKPRRQLTPVGEHHPEALAVLGDVGIGGDMALGRDHRAADCHRLRRPARVV